MVKVTFCSPCKSDNCGRVAEYELKSIMVDTDSMETAFLAACEAGGAPEKLMRYQWM